MRKDDWLVRSLAARFDVLHFAPAGGKAPSAYALRFLSDGFDGGNAVAVGTGEAGAWLLAAQTVLAERKPFETVIIQGEEGAGK
jgi:hypothetical protein